MKLTQLECFYMINKCGSFRKAAKDLGISQSAVSQIVQKTEKELNTPLFDRQGKTLTLTPAGKIVMQKAILIHDELIDLEQSISALSSNELVNTINLGFCDYSGLSSEVSIAFTVEHPEYLLNVKHRSHLRIMDSLENNEFDLCITFTRLARSTMDYFSYRRLEFGVAISKDHPLYSDKIIKAQTLKGQKVMLPLIPTVIEENIQEYYQQNNIPFIINRYAYALDPQFSSIMVEKTNCIEFLPCQMANYLDDVSIKRLDPPFYMDLAVIWNKNKFLTEPLQRIIKFLGDRIEK